MNGGKNKIGDKAERYSKDQLSKYHQGQSKRVGGEDRVWKGKRWPQAKRQHQAQCRLYLIGQGSTAKKRQQEKYDTEPDKGQEKAENRLVIKVEKIHCLPARAASVTIRF